MSINLSTTTVTSYDLTILEHLHSLTKISLESCHYLDTGTMRILGKCMKLVDISLKESPSAIGMPNILPLSGYLQYSGSSVTNLNVAKTLLTNEALLEIAEFASELCVLDVSGNPSVSDIGVHELLSQCRCLVSIDVSTNVHVTGKSLLIGGGGGSSSSSKH